MNKLNILFVDDDLTSRLFSEGVFRNHQAVESITSVASGAEAVDYHARNHYDLIFMDVRLPTIDGYEATKRIRMFDKTVPIIGITALEKSVVDESVFNTVLYKPVQASDLFRGIQDYFKL